jgi:predicted dehydrogenase
MSLYLSPEQREKGKKNFEEAVQRNAVSRRDFMKGVLAAGAAVPITAAAYFGYQQLHGNPVKVGLIGAGDEGGVLVTEHNKEYLRFVAVADIRPSNMKRIFEGDRPGPRLGFNKIYGGEATKIKQYDDYKKLLADKEIEAVVIALPLHLHAPVAIDAMRAGKHVLCEKLMAWNVASCKEMIQVADQEDRILSIGHQRHYSLLYAHAQEVLKSKELGDIKHIRALWHRNNAWQELDKDGKPKIDANRHPVFHDGWYKDIPKEDSDALQAQIKQLGYKSMEELVRWRLFQRTGGGLMAELGSHQLDACSIFLGKAHPLAVSGIGTRSFYRDQYKAHEREVDDHVFVTFEFPGPKYYADPNLLAIDDKEDVVIVTYSSISTNTFEPYGECVMGSHGTMLVVQEASIMLFPERNPSKPADTTKGLTTSVTIAGGGKPATDTAGSTGALGPVRAAATGQTALAGPPSRGYREEMEDFAYCVRMWNQANKKERRLPRCHGRVAMADAIIALTANVAMRKHQRIEFDSRWFDPASKEVPDADMKPEIIA